ncbi:hypothetical protein [Carnobacterium divergens]|uniref:Lipoprotein n=1 Tax=Carnobacterium divergens DSM 20623 TaxID=1449336 RepID=A0A0R2HXP3_CARDV|nr:hypothetical protein [Carnobacterium divergens]KRN54839.1 hypothetical protein IV74_GL002430 [Carnobacterium divergens DSM 20623]MDO0874325.1 hypothetical protein [Carnobacterium divergens]SUX21439.1 Uncharacterised protein [Carnobacterium divergens]
MKKKLLIVVFLIFFTGCYNTINKNKKNTESDNISKGSENKKKAIIIFDNNYRLVYNSAQERNEIDRKAMIEAKPLLIENFKKVKNKIDDSLSINILPLSYILKTNQNSKYISFNLFVINTSDEIITNFKTKANFSFVNNPYKFSFVTEMQDVGMEKLLPNEGVIISYEEDITDQPTEYFNTPQLEDVNVNLSELKIF